MTSSATRDLPVILQTITEIAKPEKVILFGSQADGSAGPDSDIDLFLVVDAPEGVNKIQSAIRERLFKRITSPLDLVFCSPHRFLERSGWSASFEGGIAKRGIVLHE
jgi:predicted nucleotidyltransferase